MTRVSVLISVYNGEKFLDKAILSVLDQTEKDLELVIVNDGSTDGTDAVVRTYPDPRIRYLSLPHAGRVPALNAGLKACQGDYIAILDADDLFEPEKLGIQLKFMEENSLALCGSWATVIDEDGKETGKMTYPPIGEKNIRRYCLSHNPFIHSTVMMRKDVLINAGGYKTYNRAEDYELWTRIIFKSRVDNLPQTLIKYRLHPSQSTQSLSSKMRWNAFRVRLLALLRSLSSLRV
jgi:glycosyltransferase involved in cell wall biosynthesis